MEQQVEMQYEKRYDKNDRAIQLISFKDADGNYTRDGYLTEDQAMNVIKSNVSNNVIELRTGKSYMISYLTIFDWRSGQQFMYFPRRIQLEDYVYGKEQADHYGTQAIDDFKVYAIEIRQL